MADLNFQFGSGNNSSKVASWAGRIFLCLFATPFAAFGVFAIVSGIKKLSSGDIGQGVGIGLFGLVFASVGFGLMYAAVTAVRRQRLAEEKWNAQTDGGKKVWLARADWAAGKIKSATGAQQKNFMILSVGFLAVGGISTFFVLQNELPKRNYPALLVLLFPLVGLGLMGAVIRGVLARRRFGDCWVELAQVPAPLGGSLDGLIQTERPLHLEQGLHLKLSCIERTVTSSGEGSQTNESILWQNEKVFRPDAALPSTGAGGSGIPVHFDLPADQPEASLRGNSTVIWRLEARAKMDGPDFTALFEVPVFRVAGFVPTRSAEPDPTAPLQMSGEEIRRDEHSRIKVQPVPGGMEFYFPAARNIGTAIFVTVFFLVWSVVVWFLITRHAPILFPMVFGLFDVLMLFGVLHAWFKSTRVTVNSTSVRLQSRLLIFSRTREFSAGDYQRFATKMGMQSGTKVFTDIKLLKRGADADYAQDVIKLKEAEQFPSEQKVNQLAAARFRQAMGPRGVTVASSIASAGEAEWLVREMNRALGRS